MHYMEGNSDYMIEQQLMKWRVELYAASQILKGEYLEEFKKLITEIANTLSLEVTDTGTFGKVDL